MFKKFSATQHLITLYSPLNYDSINQFIFCNDC